MQEELQEYDYRYNRKYNEMKAYYEGIYKKYDNLQIKIMLFQAIGVVIMILYTEYTRYRLYCGKISNSNICTMMRYATLIALFVVLYRLVRCILNDIFHFDSKYSAEEFFHYNCLAGKNIKKVWVVNAEAVIILYWFEGLRYARLYEYLVKGGKGKVSVIDTKNKILEVK